MEILKQIALYAIIPAAVIYSAICLFLYFFQEKLIFRPEILPSDHVYRFPLEFQELDYEPKSGVRINAVKFKCQNPKGLVYYLHGNSGSVQTWYNVADLFIEKGYDVLIIDFRGFGKSTGTISQKSLYNDAEFVYNELKKEYREDKILVYGRSLGSGMATYVASKNNPTALVLEAPYYSFKDLAHHYYPWLPHSLLLRYTLRTDKFIPNVQCPIYIFHGTDDKVVYHGSTEKLARLLKKTDRVFSIEGGTHNDLELWEEYTQNIEKILDQSIPIQ